MSTTAASTRLEESFWTVCFYAIRDYRVRHWGSTFETTHEGRDYCLVKANQHWEEGY